MQVEILEDERILTGERLRECKRAWELYENSGRMQSAADELRCSTSTISRRAQAYEAHLDALRELQDAEREAWLAEKKAKEAKGSEPKPQPKHEPEVQAAAHPDLAAAMTLLIQSQAQQTALLEKLLTKKPRKTAIDDEDEKPISGGRIEEPTSTVITGRRFVLTSAQNNTRVHGGFLASLKTFCRVNGAQLLVSRFTYNKNAYGNTDEELWYDPAIRQNVCDRSVKLADGLVFCGELDILPTAVDPLSGFESYTKEASAIVPHAKVAMKSLATMKNDPAKFLYTTGAITQRNYIPKKAGQKAEFHHVFGALYVEVDDDGQWFVRQLIAADDGAFQDLTTLYTPKGIVEDQRVEGINWGDIHIEKIDRVCLEACWHGSKSMIDTLKPKYQFVHDLSDFTPRNHHNIKNPHFLADQYFNGIDRVEVGIEKCADFLSYIQRDYCETVVVESNHDLALGKWLAEADVRRDPQNARYYHYLSYRLYEAIERADKSFSVFEFSVREKAQLDRTRFLREDESFVICPDQGGGIECSMHGHRGSNGSRGNPRGYRGLGRRCNTGHTHSAGIIDGIWTAGVTGSLDMGYNLGPSSWSHSHIVTYPNGKRSIITMRGPKWRATAAA